MSKAFMASSGSEGLYALRHRPPSDKLVDQSFRFLVTALAALVAIILFSIFLVVTLEARKAIAEFGLGFLVNSSWNPTTENFGAFTAIYGTLLTSVLAPEKARSRTILLHSTNHPPATAPTPAFTERNAWKATRKFF